GERVDGGQQPVPELRVVHVAVVDLAARLRDVEDLAKRALPVRAEQRCKGAELEPAQVQLLPLAPQRFRDLERRLDVAGLPQAEAILWREPADVERPVRYSRQA